MLDILSKQQLLIPEQETHFKPYLDIYINLSLNHLDSTILRLLTGIGISGYLEIPLNS